MEIQIAEQKIYQLLPQFSLEQIKEKAWDKKVAVFFAGLASIFSRPKSEDIQISSSEKRYEPFWYISTRTHYVYDRQGKCRFPVGEEVQTVTIQGVSFSVQDEKKAGCFLIVPVVEHCQEEHRKEAYFDGQSGERKDFSYALYFNKNEILELSSFFPDGIIIAPEIRASSVIRQIMGEVIRPLQADEIQEEEVIIENLELYFRPVFAFEFRWQAKEKAGIAEFDGLTGEMRTGGKMWRESLKKLDTNVLFDIGADVLGMVFPGGNIAIKLTKAAIDYKKGK